MRKAKSLSLLILILLALPYGSSNPADAGQKSPFEGCGTLVEGVTCPFFLEVKVEIVPGIFINEYYQLEDFGDFELGDRVFVTGDAFPCASVCQQGSCLTVFSMTECPISTDTQSFGNIKARFDRD